MSELTLALITIFGTVASVSGVVAYVFNGTRKLIREIHATIQEMHKEADQRHQEVLASLNQQHQDVVELLKKGFGELIQHRQG